MLHKGQTAKQLLKTFDYVGLVLFSAGMLLLLMGLNWGGVCGPIVDRDKNILIDPYQSLYPWKSGHVISTIVSGVAAFTIFGLYETFNPWN